MIRLTATRRTCCLLLALAPAHAALAADDSPPRVVDFNRDIRPILSRHCTACHGGVKQAGGLSFVYAEPIQGVVEPGSPDDSYLIERVATPDEDYRMPPPEHGPRLPEKEVSLLRKWVEQGARWERHWAYQTPIPHPSPEVRDQPWRRQPMDDFILAELESRGVEPAGDERPRRWLRRVSLDLIGLPPTPEELAAFLDDLGERGEKAYESVVDRLLESPRFGERWASVWLDQVRYADSRGQGEDSPRDIWKYRDWVIDALNRDMPYDQFTIKQVAGDLLPDRTIEDRLATAAHRLTHTNEEGGTDDEEFRVAAVLDRVHTTWQTWQGTTIGCVQCHDHPYDPIRHEDFYRSVAYFNNTADCDLSDDWPTVKTPIDPADYDKASELDRQIESLQKSLWSRKFRTAHQQASWTPLRIAGARTSNQTKVVVEEKEGAEKGDAEEGDYDEYHTVGTIARSPTITVETKLPSLEGPITGVRINASPLDPSTALPDAEVGFVMSRISVSLKRAESDKAEEVPIAEVIGDEPFPHDNPQDSLKKNSSGFGAYTRVNHVRHVVLLPKEPIEAQAGDRLVVKVHYGVFDLAAFSLVARRASFSVSTDPALTGLRNDKELREDRRKLSGLRKERRKIESIATPVLVERPEHLERPSHVFIRGLFLTKDKEVEPGAPDSLYAGDKPLDDRLAFARWMVSPQNPLTARVAVNRYWARMFGVGLVATEEDFGSSGDLPSHPELLDDLSVRFRDEYHWSVKALLREMALSRTYRQSSQAREDLPKPDPQNRLLARGPRHTLPAETIRDQMLAISGLLSTKMHGPPVHPPLPPRVWKARRGSWETEPVGDPDRYRRSVYTYVKRSVPYPIYAAFDAPSRDFCQPKRLRSNTPLQALMLLNDTTFVECAEALAGRMNQAPGGLPEKLAEGFRLATCREPNPGEVDSLARLHEKTSTASGDQQAMEAVAAVLLNLDEVVTK